MEESMKASRLLMVITLTCLIASSLSALPPTGITPTVHLAHATIIDHAAYINANRILGFVGNDGSLFSDWSQLLLKSDGLYFPYSSIADILSGANNKTVVYSAGLWLGGKVGGDLRVTVSEYSAEYTPGPMVNGTFVSDAYTDPQYRVYRLYADSQATNPNQDYLQWPADQGAPVDGAGKPLFMGDQTLWTVFNDADPSQHTNNTSSSLPLGIEVHQTVWAGMEIGEANAVNIQYKLYNRSAHQIDSFYLSFWCDSDLGRATDDLIGCDTLQNVFFCYNASDSDAVYGIQPPAWGGRVIAGPLVSDTGGMGLFCGKPILDRRNLGMTSFQRYINGTDPSDKFEAFNLMKGFDRHGNPLANGTRFACPGDPVTGVGDLDINPSDRRLMVSFGPLIFLPGDSQQLVLKIAVGQDKNRLASITHLKEILTAHNVHPTDQWIDVYCQNPTLDGLPLHPGDTIRAYDPTGVLCGIGLARDSGSFGFLPIYRDDITSIEDEGAVPGETIRFTVNGSAVMTAPSVVWSQNGERIQVCTFLQQECRNLRLHEGWNLVSWNVAYSEHVREALSLIRGCIDVVLGFDRVGRTYDPDLEEFSTLDSVDHQHGYWIRIKPLCDTVLRVCGGQVTGSIPVSSGWNLVSYWPAITYDPAYALASLVPDLLIAYGFENGIRIYRPGMAASNTLDSLRANLGYWVNVSNDDQLLYPGFTPNPVMYQAARPTAKAFQLAASREWMSVYGSRLTLDGADIRDGAVLEFRTDEDVLCGQGQYTNAMLKFTPLYGLASGDAISSRYPRPLDSVILFVDGVATSPAIVWEGFGARVALPALTTRTGGGNIPRAYSLGDAYPNPFNPTARIAFGLPIAGRVTLIVYNVLGQEVRTLVNEMTDAGFHTIEWNSTSDDGQQVSSGVYLYRLSAGDFMQTKKMVLLK